MEKMDKKTLAAFGKRIKELRHALRISQREMARNVKLSPSYISDIEAGKVRAGHEFFHKVSTLYNANLYFLIHGTGEMFKDAEDNKYSLGERKIGEPIESLNQLMWYCQNSLIVRHTVIGYASRFIMENRSTIKTEIDINKEYHKEKKDLDT